MKTILLLATTGLLLAGSAAQAQTPLSAYTDAN